MKRKNKKREYRIGVRAIESAIEIRIVNYRTSETNLEAY